ncbi:cellulase-like family protein [Microbacterium sp. F1-18]
MTRYLGSGHDPAPDTRALTGVVPAHLPPRLTITLWDFSWYTRAGDGEPYADLGAALDEAVDRGYNAVRICAAPLLLFGGLGLDDLASDLEIEGLGRSPHGEVFGNGTRWYDVPGGYRLDLRSRFFDLLRGARERGIVVILASWEYQQSPAFAADERWFRAIDAVPLAERYDVLATATIRMLDEIESAGLADTIAFTELHNEVDFSIVPAFADGGDAALDRVRAAHPGHLVTASYGKAPFLDLVGLSDRFQVAQLHVYAYGVLDALQRRIDIRSEGTDGFPGEAMRALLVDDAPSFAEYGRAADWKFEATVITDQQIYGYDWVDPDLWDRWLYNHYGLYREEMLREIRSRVTALAAWSRRRGIPAVVGEGWVGYTPLRADFEDGPVGTELAEHGVRTALEHGVWGMVLSSNAAPHHPQWSDVAWQRRLNAEILAAPTTAADDRD